jgi:hypothetical protein
MKMLVIAVQFSRGGAGRVDEDVGQPASAWRPEAAVADTTGWPGIPEGSQPTIEEVPMALPQNGTEDESVNPVVDTGKPMQSIRTTRQCINWEWPPPTGTYVQPGMRRYSLERR